MIVRKDILNFNKILKVSLFLFCVNPVLSQTQISFRQLSVKEGLSQNSVVSVSQDSIGYLWIATQNGLNKYDGKTFTTYPFDFVDITRPTYSYLGQVYVDQKGAVWIMPLDKTLHKLSSDSDTFKPMPIIKDVRIIFQDKKLNYWAGVWNKDVNSQKINRNYSYCDLLKKNSTWDKEEHELIDLEVYN